MTKVLNFFGGPGVGKSTTATGVFHELKKRDISCEYVSEYAKDIVWEEINKLLENQIHVFSEQLRRQYRLINKVDYIITDSPLLLSSVYYKFYTDQNPSPVFSQAHTDLTIQFFDLTFSQFDNVNFVIKRQKAYQSVGRIQTEDEAKVVDELVLDKLKFNHDHIEINYYDAVNEVLKNILS